MWYCWTSLARCSTILSNYTRSIRLLKFSEKCWYQLIDLKRLAGQVYSVFGWWLLMCFVRLTPSKNSIRWLYWLVKLRFVWFFSILLLLSSIILIEFIRIILLKFIEQPDFESVVQFVSKLLVNRKHTWRREVGQHERPRVEALRRRNCRTNKCTILF